MTIRKNIHKTNAIAPKLPDTNYMANRIGFWALVTEQNSLNNTVTVVSDTGYEYKNIPVKSDEWVTVDDNKEFIDFFNYIKKSGWANWSNICKRPSRGFESDYRFKSIS